MPRWPNPLLSRRPAPVATGLDHNHACKPHALRNFATFAMAASALPPPLLQAYRAAHYHLNDCDWFLQLGQAQPALARYYQRHAVRCATYLTACNPWGELLPDTHNAQRMDRLRQALQRAGWSWLDGHGQDPDGAWPGEDSVLVWGMSESTARAWGQEWQQNAVLHCGADMQPQLVLLR